MLIAQQSLAPTFEAVRWDALSSGWRYALAAAVAGLLVAVVWRLYRKDSIELRPAMAWCLVALRLGALVGLGAWLVEYEKRVDRLDVYDSRVLVLVDKSLSMARVDLDVDGSAAAAPRIEQAAGQLTGGLIDGLRERHQVHVYTFGQQPEPQAIAVVPKRSVDEQRSPDQRPIERPTERSADRPAETPRDAADPSGPESTQSGRGPDSRAATWRQLAVEAGQVVPKPVWWALGAVVAASIALVVTWCGRADAPRRLSAGQWLCAAIAALFPAAPIVALVALIVAERHAVDEAAERTPSATRRQNPARGDAATGTEASTATAEGAVDWAQRIRAALAAQDHETRIGDALRRVVDEQRMHPVAGVVLLTDGGNNAGIDPLAAAADAREAGMPVYAVGLGSPRKSSNVRISELAAPARVFPDDDFTITAYVQAAGLADRMVNVDLHSTLDSARRDERHEGAQRVRLAADGETLSVTFPLSPGEPGRRTYVVRIEQLAEDHLAEDNEAHATVEVINRKLRVLLMAGGPTREYRYLRNMLHRDKDVRLDVLLQTAPPGPGISQDADEILAEFPRARQQLAEYDCVVAFDPDWTQLDADQVDVLEDWVGNHSGGLIAAAGPVYTAGWAVGPRSGAHMAKIRALYPVVFPRRGLSLASDLEKFRSKTPWQLELTRSGLDAPFLRLEDTAAASEQAWSAFAGVYGYYPVSGHKPGATVYARYSTPQASGELPVYLAGQFYGSGRVFYMGSGELWRIRGLDPAYFERLYTKLIRHIAEGRLLRGTRRGSILLEASRYTLGQAIEIQAVLKDGEMQPLLVDRAALQVTAPGGSVETIDLVPHAARPGMYRGELVAARQGNYQLELQVPGTPYELVAETIRVLEPDLEGEHARRNDALLRAMAQGTGGKYFVGVDVLRPQAGRRPLVDDLRDATRLVRVRGTPSDRWNERWSTVLALVICGLLFCEWTLRRLVKLA